MRNRDSLDKVWNSSGKCLSYKSMDVDIDFYRSDPETIESAVAGVLTLAAIIAPFVNIGINLITRALEENAKSFTSEFIINKSNLEAEAGKIPKIVFTKKIGFDGEKPNETALEIHFNVKKLTKISAFVYYIEKLELVYSSAETDKSAAFDYIIALKVSKLTNDGICNQELHPIVIPSVTFGINEFNTPKHRSDVIPFSDQAALTDISLHIIEINREKVEAEELLSLWNENKDHVTTIVTNYFTKKEQNKPKDSDPGQGYQT